MYSMKETCLKVGMSYETLKYYCNEGLIPNVKRDKNNYRVFDDNNIDWINSLSCLKKCGMGINDMKKYLSYCMQGNSTIPERKKMLEIQKQFLLDKIKELNESVEFINWKQSFYDDILSGKIKHDNYFLNKKDND